MSGGIVGVLVAFAVPADLALVSVLAYRAIAIWLPAPIGLVALGSLRRTMARWSEEDAPAAPPSARPLRRRSRARRARAPSPRCWPHEAASRDVAGAAGGARARPARPAGVRRAGRRRLRPGDGGRRAPARRRGLAHRPLRHARALDLRAGRRARLPGDGRLRRAGRAGRDGDRRSAASSPPRAAWTSARSSSSRGWPRRSATSRASRSASAWAGASWSTRGPRLGITAARLRGVEAFFDRHGPKAILIGRFIGIVRAVAPFLAGASGMRLRSFLPWSLLGTALWATAFTLVGYAFHESFASAAHTLTHGALGLAVVVAAVLAIRAHRQARARGSARPRCVCRCCAASNSITEGRVSGAVGTRAAANCLGLAPVSEPNPWQFAGTGAPAEPRARRPPPPPFPSVMLLTRRRRTRRRTASPTTPAGAPAAPRGSAGVPCTSR